MLRSRFVRSFVLVLTTFVAISCADYTPIEPITAPTKAQDGLIGDLLGLVTGLLARSSRSFHSSPIRTESRSPQSSGLRRTLIRRAASPGPLVTTAARSPSGARTSRSHSEGRANDVDLDHDHFRRERLRVLRHEAARLRFAKPVIVTQSLKNTAVYKTPVALNAACAYFPKDLLNLSGVLKALEIETTTIYSAPTSGQQNGQYQLVPEVETWQLNHFSRYMLASG